MYSSITLFLDKQAAEECRAFVRDTENTRTFAVVRFGSASIQIEPECMRGFIETLETVEAEMIRVIEQKQQAESAEGNATENEGSATV